MLGALLGIAAVVVGVLLFLRGAVAGDDEAAPKSQIGQIGQIIRGKLPGLGLVAFGLFLIAQTSYVFVDSDRVGHLKLIYAFEELPEGRIIALSGQKGPQARTLGPGFHFIPLVRVLYDIEEFPVIEVPQGYYGAVTALDGAPLPEGSLMAPAIPEDKVDAMLLDAEYFLTHGGVRGPQETVLKPGRYRINQYLFRVEATNDTAQTTVPAGFVGVVKSNVKLPGVNCTAVVKELSTSAATEAARNLSVPLVPRGCVGLWREPLLPGAYYLNRRAYEVTLIETRVKSWEYRGGYTRRSIDLTVDQEGNIQQTARSQEEPVPSIAADRAVFTRIESWDIPLELRAQVQVQPENAPIVVGSVGGIEQVENQVLTPAIRSIVRNVTGGQIRVPVRGADGAILQPVQYQLRPTRALDLIDNRDAIEDTIEELIKIEGRKAGIEIKEIRLGEPVLPPELLLVRRRDQLASEFTQTYQRETAAQKERIEREQARATANEQPRLVEAQIAVQVAQQREAERAALGRAERQYLEELAKGQSAQALVLGQDRVALLQGLEKLLASLERKPELVKLIGRLVPQTVVTGGGENGLAGAAAILGGVLGGQQPRPQPQTQAEPQQ